MHLLRPDSRKLGRLFLVGLPGHGVLRGLELAKLLRRMPVHDTARAVLRYVGRPVLLRRRPDHAAGDRHGLDPHRGDHVRRNGRRLLRGQHHPGLSL